MTRMSKSIATAIVLAGFAAAPLAFAHDDNTAGKRPTAPQDMQEMMKGMQGGMGGMMGMMTMMSQMGEMMQTCNKMMQAMAPSKDTPAQDGKKPNNG